MSTSITSTAGAMKPLRRLMREEEPEWLVWALVAIMLALGGIVGIIVERRTETETAGSLSVRYPVGWVKMSSEAPFELLRVGEPFEAASFPASVSVRQMPISEISTTAQTLGDLALKWTNQQTQELLGHKVLSIEPATVQDQNAVKIDSVHVAEPPMGGPDSIPVIARVVDVLIRENDTLTIATFSADAGAFDDQAATWGRILASLKLK